LYPGKYNYFCVYMFNMFVVDLYDFFIVASTQFELKILNFGLNVTSSQDNQFTMLHRDDSYNKFLFQSALICSRLLMVASLLPLLAANTDCMMSSSRLGNMSLTCLKSSSVYGGPGGMAGLAGGYTAV